MINSKLKFCTAIITFLTSVFMMTGCQVSDAPETYAGSDNTQTMELNLLAPADVTATDGKYTGKIVITWKAVENAKYYIVLRSESPDGEFEKITYKITKNSYENTIIKKAFYYYYKVRAISADETVESELSASDGGYAGTKPTALKTPVIKSVATGSEGILDITWDAVAGADYYIIYKSTTGVSATSTTTATGTYVELNNHVISTIYSDSDIVPAMWYYYKVKAMNSQNESQTSIAFKGFTGELPAIPSTPVGVTASDRKYENYIKVSWNLDESVSFYYVYRADTEDGQYVKISGKVTGLNYYEDKGMSDDKIYFYKVQACTSYGSSEMSEPAGGAIIQIVEPELLTGSKLVTGDYSDTYHKYSFRSDGGCTLYQLDDNATSWETYNGRWGYSGNTLSIGGSFETWGWGYGQIDLLYRKFNVTLTKTFDNAYTILNGSKLILMGKKKSGIDSSSITGTYNYSYTANKVIKVWSWVGSQSWGWWSDYKTETIKYDYVLTVKADRTWTSVLYKNGVMNTTKNGTVTNSMNSSFVEMNGSFYYYDDENMMLKYN